MSNPENRLTDLANACTQARADCEAAQAAARAAEEAFKKTDVAARQAQGDVERWAGPGATRDRVPNGLTAEQLNTRKRLFDALDRAMAAAHESAAVLTAARAHEQATIAAHRVAAEALNAAKQDPKLIGALVAHRERELTLAHTAMLDAEAARAEAEHALTVAREAGATAYQAMVEARTAYDADPKAIDAYQAALENEKLAKLNTERAERLLAPLASAAEQRTAERQAARVELARARASSGYHLTLLSPAIQQMRAAGAAMVGAIVAWAEARDESWKDGVELANATKDKEQAPRFPSVADVCRYLPDGLASPFWQAFMQVPLNTIEAIAAEGSEGEG